MSDLTLPLSGAHTKVRIFVGNNPPFGDDIVVSWSIEEEAEIFRDDHVGNDYSLGDVRSDGWNIQLELHHASTKLIDAFEARRQAIRELGARRSRRADPYPIG